MYQMGFFKHRDKKDFFDWQPPDPADIGDPVNDNAKKFTRYIELVREHNTLRAAAVSRIQNGDLNEVADIKALTAKARAKTSGWMDMKAETVQKEMWELGEQAKNIYEPYRVIGYGRSGTVLYNAYVEFRKVITDAWETYQQLRTCEKMETYLAGRIDAAEEFLESARDQNRIGQAKGLIEMLGSDNKSVSERCLRLNPQLAGHIPKIDKLIDELALYVAEKTREEESRRTRYEGDAKQIRDLYKQFAAAYVQRDAYALTRFLTGDWETDDGTGIDDMEEMLDNSFDVFDEVQMTITELGISGAPDGTYRVGYKTTLIGIIYDNDLKHREESTVTDTVIMTGSGPKISHTSGGSFWMR